MICENIFGVHDHVFDKWILSHILLPFYAHTHGIKAIYVLSIVYLWESLELGIRCLSTSESNWSADESMENALIVDPLCGILGILFGYMIANEEKCEIQWKSIALHMVSTFFLFGEAKDLVYFMFLFYNIFLIPTISCFIIKDEFTSFQHQFWKVFYTCILFILITCIELNSLFLGIACTGILSLIFLIYTKCSIISKTSKVGICEAHCEASV